MFLRRGRCHPNRREEQVAQIQAEKRPEFLENSTICMDKHEMETERTQSYKAQIKETFLDTAVGWWDAITSSLIQCQAQNAQ